MSDEIKSTVSEIGRQLRDGQLSRASLSDRLKVLGIGFGAAVVLGVTGANATTGNDASVTLKSSNATLNSIIQTGPQTLTIDPKLSSQRVAYYRYYHRYYTRHYNRYYGRY